MESDDVEKQFKCDWCGKPYAVYYDLDRHMLIHGPDDPISLYQCDICDESCASEEDLNRHLVAHDNEYFCDICDKLCKSADELDNHMATHDFNSTFPCNICERTFILESDLERHNLMQHDESEAVQDSYSCQICGKSLETEIGLTRHKLAVHGDRSVVGNKSKCPHCDKQFLYKRNVLRHIKEVHPLEKSDPRKPYTSPERQKDSVHSLTNNLSCEFCEKKFTSKKGFSRHMEFHKYRTILTKSTIKSRQGKVKCKFCGRLFVWRKNVNRHIKEEHAKQLENSFSCKICDVTFSLEEEINEHMKSHFIGLSENKYKCIVCGKLFKYERKFVSHVRQSHQNELKKYMNKYSCKICGKVFDSGQGLSNHMRKHKNERDLKKTAVEKIDWNDNSSNMNESSHLSELKKYSCKRCNKVFDSSQGLSNHMRKHKSEGDLEKTAVEKINSDDNNFSNIKEPSSVEPNDDLDPDIHYCRSCDECFPTRVSLKRHMSLYHSKNYICDVCKSSYSTKLGLEIHMNTHYAETSEKEFECVICKQVFNNSHTLTSHFRSHKLDDLSMTVTNASVTDDSAPTITTTERNTTTARRHRCKKCSKPFITIQGLLSHMRSHDKLEKLSSKVMTIGKPGYAQKCPICGKIFPNASSLGSHLKMHESAESGTINESKNTEASSHANFSCSHCGKRFLRQTNLDLHIRNIHTGKTTSLSCSICGAKFRYPSKLKRHHLTHAARNCEICGKTFYSYQSLSNHLKTHRLVSSHTHKDPDAEDGKTENSASEGCVATGQNEAEVLTGSHNKFSNLHEQTTLGKTSSRGDISETLRNESTTENDVHYSSSSEKPLKSKLKLVSGQNPPSYSCRECDESFDSVLLLKDHMPCHDLVKYAGGISYTVKFDVDGEKRFHCSYCERSYGRKSRLWRHHRAKHLNFPLIFSEKTRFQEVISTSYRNATMEKEMHPTQTSEKPIDSYSELVSGQNSTITLHKCPQCEEIFNSVSLLEEHMSCHELVKYSGGISFTVKFDVEGEKRFHCRYCEESYARAGALLIHHRAKHTDILLKYPCEICGKQFTMVQYVRDHHEQYHVKTPAKFLCDYPNCKKIFDTKYEHEIHKEKCEYQKEYGVCGICKRIFMSQSALDTHMQNHSRVGDTYDCEICDRSFSTQQLRDEHRSLNHEESSVTEPTAQKHSEVNDKVFKCRLCNKRFYEKDLICSHITKEHMIEIKRYKKETGILPYKIRTRKVKQNENAGQSKDLIDDSEVQKDDASKRAQNNGESETALECMKGFPVATSYREQDEQEIQESTFYDELKAAVEAESSIERKTESLENIANIKSKSSLSESINDPFDDALKTVPRSSLDESIGAIIKHDLTISNDFDKNVTLTSDNSGDFFLTGICDENMIILDSTEDDDDDEQEAEHGIIKETLHQSASLIPSKGEDVDVAVIGSQVCATRKMDIDLETEKYYKKREAPKLTDQPSGTPDYQEFMEEGIFERILRVEAEFNKSSAPPTTDLTSTQNERSESAAANGTHREIFSEVQNYDQSSESGSLDLVLSNSSEDFETESENKNVSSSFSSGTELNIHKLAHRSDSPKPVFKCEKCNKLFKSTTALQKHMKTHDSDNVREKYNCKKCGKHYSSKSELSMHMKTHGSKKAKTINKNAEKLTKKKKLGKHRCNRCGRIFKSEEMFLRHVKLHKIKI